MTFHEFTNDIATTIVVSLDIDEYESEYDKIVKVYADWVYEMPNVCAKDRAKQNLS